MIGERHVRPGNRSGNIYRCDGTSARVIPAGFAALHDVVCKDKIWLEVMHLKPSDQ